MPRILISAAEPSGDLHGAALIRAARRLDEEIEFVGVAGPAMQAAGCRALADLTGHSAMLLGALGNIQRGRRVLKSVRDCLAQSPCDAAVVIDSPMLHLPMAKYIARAGVPVLYYVAPQLWAWGRWRMARLRRRTAHLAVILPFEQGFFQSHHCTTTFVGHPLFDTLLERSPDESAVNGFRQAGDPVIALLPGSRAQEINSLLPDQLRIADAIRQRYPKAHIVVSIADDRLGSVAQTHLNRASTPVAVHRGELVNLLSAAKLALVASGTVTLEVAYYRTPMIVMYNASKWFYHLLGRWLIHTKHLSLVNILAGRELVPEFMPYYSEIAPITATALELLGDADRRDRMCAELGDLIAPLAHRGASERAAGLLLDLVARYRDRQGAARATTRSGADRPRAAGSRSRY